MARLCRKGRSEPLYDGLPRPSNADFRKARTALEGRPTGFRTEPSITDAAKGFSNGQSVSESFERGFLAHDLRTQIEHCDHYELAGYFRHWLPANQPILEAGCGSGRWVGWFASQGWDSAGLDWSEVCCRRASLAIPDARFAAGDMRDMPFDDGEFGAIVSLGAVEHSPEGPMRSLREYHRVLRSGGIAVITVPYLSPARRMHRLLNVPKEAMVRNPLLRRLLGKRTGGRTLGEARRQTLPGYAADFMVTRRGVEFYQYNFSKPQMRAFLRNADLEIVEEFVDFGDEGILHNFGRLSGVYDFDRGKVSLTPLGKVLRGILPVDLMGHMLCYLVRKNGRTGTDLEHTQEERTA